MITLTEGVSGPPGVFEHKINNHISENNTVENINQLPWNRTGILRIQTRHDNGFQKKNNDYIVATSIARPDALKVILSQLSKYSRSKKG